MDIPFHYYIFIIGAILLVVGIVGLIVKRGGDRRDSPQNPYIEALKLRIAGDDDGAFRELQRAVKIGAAPTDAYIRLGNLLRERGESNKALQIHQSLTVKTNLSKVEKHELFLSLAEDYAKLGNSEKAVRVLETAIRNQNLREPSVFLTLARHYHVLGENDKAYDALKEAKRYDGLSDRELALYLASSGEQLAEKGDGKESKKALQRALKHDPDCAPALMTLGNLAEGSGSTDEAIDSWRRAAVISPQLSEAALSKLERTLYESGRFSDIEKIYTDVRGARTGDEAANLSLAAFYKKQGRGEDAIQLLEDYLAIYPESVRASLLLTSFYAKHRDDDTLERFLDDAIAQSGKGVNYHCTGCGFQSDTMRWHCPRCNRFDSFSTNNVL